ncbi:hypothetical protein [Actinomadura rayongensis]|uniref:Uncharacterized protein n=1 Tax=Actinomadura rayongensis TaxID=1429076 RepID=A0A6I4W618_9ACTN|nr:hypothetical protein [Actinomadura rayongensis]MXQ65617.1 hypothetical protein [Actinomadura rayongensis]
MDPIAVTGLSASFISTGISILAWRAAHRSSTADQATSRIEADRRHGELTPRFTVVARPGNLDHVDLWVELSGPVELGGLDGITISVRDDIPGRTPVSPAGPTAEEIAAQVWATHQFVHGGDGADEHGRSVNCGPLRVGQRRQFVLKPTRPAHWMSESVSAESWQAERAEHPFVLELVCRKEGSPDWTVPIKVELP